MGKVQVFEGGRGAGRGAAALLNPRTHFKQLDKLLNTALIIYYKE